MKYETVQTLRDEDFKRSTGVQRSTFERMLEVVETGLRDFGRPSKLSRADQLLLTLMYWREYRTEFHIGLTYGVSEATVCRTIKKVEDVLIQSEQFHLPGKKALGSYVDGVQSDERSDKGRRNSLEIAAEFRHRHVPTQIHFVNTFERTQVVSDISPHAFGGIGVNFSNTISIIVTCPFVFGMANS